MSAGDGDAPNRGPTDRCTDLADIISEWRQPPVTEAECFYLLGIILLRFALNGTRRREIENVIREIWPLMLAEIHNQPAAGADEVTVFKMPAYEREPGPPPRAARRQKRRPH